VTDYRAFLVGVEAVTSPSAPPATQRVGLAGIEVVSSVDNIDCWVWDGSQEVPASVFVWDGAQEVPASLAVA
jgi:hypothetical protein